MCFPRSVFYERMDEFSHLFKSSSWIAQSLLLLGNSQHPEIHIYLHLNLEVGMQRFECFFPYRNLSVSSDSIKDSSLPVN